MQVRCIKPFGTSVPGDVAEVPDGAAVDPGHWEPVTAEPEAPEAPGPAPEAPERAVPHFHAGMRPAPLAAKEM